MEHVGLKPQEKQQGETAKPLLTLTCADQIKLPSKVNMTEVVYGMLAWA